MACLRSTQVGRNCSIGCQPEKRPQTNEPHGGDRAAGRLPMKRTALISLAIAVGFASEAGAHELITTRIIWTQHISRIFYKRCVSCHRKGASAFSLTRYREARPWAKAIKNQILIRRMPPWGAVKGFGHFRNDMSLTEREIALVSSWVEGGAPEGHLIYMPAMPGEEAFAEPEPPPSIELAIQGVVPVEKQLQALGIRPESVPEGGSLEVIARTPDGSTQYLIWLRDYQKRWRRSYYFREPVELPPGTKIFVHPAAGVSASLLTAVPSPAR